MPFKKYLFLFLFFYQFGFCQLSNFTLQVTATNETCSGNGGIQFSVFNTQPNAQIQYSVFLLPNQTTPITITSNNQLMGLNSGNYLVVATQTLNGSSGTKQQQVTIQNLVTALTFTISDQKVKCATDGALTVNVSSGVAVNYELLTGPVTRPLQASNVFPNLPVGNYSIRAYDTCGNAVVNSITLTQLYTPIVINSAQVKANSIGCQNLVLEASTNYSFPDIAFPLTVEFKIYPPNSAPALTYTQTISSFTIGTIQQSVTRFDGTHFFDVKITDACGNIVSKNNNRINADLGLNMQAVIGCSLGLSLNFEKAILPYTIDFISSPAGFNPTQTYSYHPGPYNITTATFNNVPSGIYTAKITDSCNKTVTVTADIHNPTIAPIFYTATNDGCGTIKIFNTAGPGGIYFQSVIMVSAPSTYQGVLPLDLSSLIVHVLDGAGQIIGSSVTYSGLPPGNYVFHILDSCGVLNTLNVTVPVGIPASVSFLQYPGCSVGFGTVKVYYSGNTNYNIQSAIVTNAPSSFPHALPYTLTNIASSNFSLIDIPEGNYTVKMTSVCGNVQTDAFSVVGYKELNTTVEVQQFCSTFNLKFSHQGNGVNPLYALQKFNPVTGQWVHPVTGLPIVSNQINFNNFYSILPDQLIINLPFSGRFRIIKDVERIDLEKCINSIKEFEVSSNPKIDSYNIISCTNGLSTVVINATGIGQLQYRITEKDNQPFFVNNGNSNVFVNLLPAVYNFQVEDSCGNILNRQIQIFPSLPLSITPTLCENQASSLSVSNYSFLSYEWWKDGAPNAILSTSNVLAFNPFIAATHNGIYHVRIIHLGNSASCLNTELSFTVSAALSNPSAGNDYTETYCTNPGVLNLNTHLSGIYSSNGYWVAITPNTVILNGLIDTTNLNYGTYEYHYVVNGFCNQNDTAVFTIHLAEQPTLPTLQPLYSLCEGDALTIDAGFQSNVSYFWTGPNGFSSNSQTLVFSSIGIANDGVYTLQLKKGNCATNVLTFQINVSPFPKIEIEELCIDNHKALRIVSGNPSFNAQDFIYQWTGPNNFTSDQPLIYIETLGTYSVEVNNTSNCTQSANYDVESLMCTIPKGISPNGDGLNDYFDLSGLDIEYLKIFNRYGTEVYSEEKYKKEWHGQTSKGSHLLPTATYYYVIKLTDGKSKTGWVYLTY